MRHKILSNVRPWYFFKWLVLFTISADLDVLNKLDEIYKLGTTMNKNFLSFFLCDAAEKTTAVILYTYITFQNTLCSVTVDFCAQSSWLKKLLQTIRPPLPLLPWLVSLDLVCPCSFYLQMQAPVWLQIPTLVLAGSHSYYIAYDIGVNSILLYIIWRL